MPKQIQYLYKMKPVFDLCNQENVVELYNMISAENFLANIELSEEGEVRLLSECALDEIRLFESALREETRKNNLNPFFRAYIRNLFELHEHKRAIEEKTQLLASYPEEQQKLNEQFEKKATRLEMLKRSNEPGIQEIEKNCAALKAERNNYELFQFVVVVITMLPIVPLGFISSIAALIAIPVILGVVLLEEKFFESGNSFYTDKLEELYAKRSSLKEPISNLEIDLKSTRRRIASLEQVNSDTQEQLQKLKEQQATLEKKITNFNLEQLAPLNLKSTLSKKSMFKEEGTPVSFKNAPETDEAVEQPKLF
ncbi:hypothetical protein ACD661_15045 [Legionella lytica]|uniref:Coiled-coil protein n=1 Tax=Legionella lytica TaxID=96232 RepID=A0ABW8DAX6_9GAMM